MTVSKCDTMFEPMTVYVYMRQPEITIMTSHVFAERVKHLQMVKMG